MAIITRGEKGKPLTNDELDNNFIEIRNALGQTTPSNVSSFQAFIYKRSATPPDSPEGGSYNFLQGAFQEIPYGWYASPPGGTSPIYVSSTLFITSNISAPAEAGLWSNPVLLSEGGDGQGSINRSIVYIYKRSANEPPLDDRPTGNVSVSLSGDNYGQITGPDPLGSGWYKDIQASNSLPLYLRAATATDRDRDGTDTIETGEWTDSILFTQDGQDGINARTVFLYIRTQDDNTPVEVNQLDPTGSVTYNFETKAITTGGDFSGWSTGIPSYSVNNSYLWVSQATAASRTSQDTISSQEFSDAEILSVDGQSGAAGQSAVQYYLTSSANIIAKNSAGTIIAPDSLTFNAYRISGNNEPELYEDYFIEYSGFNSDGFNGDKGGITGSSLTYSPIPLATTRVEAYLKPESGTSFTLSNLSVPVISDGESAQKSAVVYAYKRTGDSSLASTDVPPETITVSLDGPNFGKITSTDFGTDLPDLGSGWYTNIPDVGGNYLFISTATAQGNAADTEDNLLTGDWSSGALLSQVGEDGLTSAVVEIYLRNGSRSPVPTLPTQGSFTYTFDGGIISNYSAFNNDWTTGIPDDNNGDPAKRYLWVSKSVLTSSSGSGIVDHSDFTEVNLLSANGEDPYVFDITSNTAVYRILDGQDYQNVGPKTDITSGIVYYGTENVTSDFTLSIIGSGGVNGGGITDNQLDINSFTQNEGYVDLQATKNGGPTMEKRWSFQIIKDGADGQPGADGQDADAVPLNLINESNLTLEYSEITTLSDEQGDGSVRQNISSSVDVSGNYTIAFLDLQSLTSKRKIETKNKIKLFNYDKVYLYVNKGGARIGSYSWGSSLDNEENLYIEYDLDGTWDNIGFAPRIGEIQTSDLDYNIWTKFYFEIPQEAKNENGVYLRIAANTDYNSINHPWAVSSLFFNTLGDPGPGLVYRGDYNSSATYYYSDIRRDVVKASDNTYYITNNSTKDNQDDWGDPISATDDWIAFSDTFEAVATKLLLAEDATITKTITIGGETNATGVLRSSDATNTNANLTGYKGTGFYLNSNGDFYVGSGNTDDTLGRYLFFDADEGDLTLRADNLIIGTNNQASGLIFIQDNVSQFLDLDDNILYVGEASSLSSKNNFTFGGGGTLYNYGELELSVKNTSLGTNFGSGNIKLGYSQYTYTQSEYAQPSLYLSGVEFQNATRHFDYIISETGTNEVIYTTYGQTGSQGKYAVSVYQNTFQDYDNVSITINSNPENGGIFFRDKENTFNNLLITTTRGSVQSRSFVRSSSLELVNYAIMDFDFSEKFSGINASIDIKANIDSNIADSEEAYIFNGNKIGVLSGDYQAYISGYDKFYLTGARSGYFYYNIGDGINWGQAHDYYTSYSKLQYNLDGDPNWYDIHSVSINYLTEENYWHKTSFAIPESAKNSNGVYLRFQSSNNVNPAYIPSIALSNFYVDEFTGFNANRYNGMINFDQRDAELRIESLGGQPATLTVSGYKTYAPNGSIVPGLSSVIPFKKADNTSGNLFFYNGLYVGVS